MSYIENGGTFISNDYVISGTIIEEPSITRTGYDFNGWFTDDLFNNQFDFSIPIRSNITLYAKWTSIYENEHIWEYIPIGKPDETIYPNVSSYVCPADYTIYLPDPDTLEIGYIIAVQPLRNCNTSSETCLYDPVLDKDYQVCELKRYRIVST